MVCLLTLVALVKGQEWQPIDCKLGLPELVFGEVNKIYRAVVGVDPEIWAVEVMSGSNTVGWDRSRYPDPTKDTDRDKVVRKQRLIFGTVFFNQLGFETISVSGNTGHAGFSFRFVPKVEQAVSEVKETHFIEPSLTLLCCEKSYEPGDLIELKVLYQDSTGKVHIGHIESAGFLHGLMFKPDSGVVELKNRRLWAKKPGEVTICTSADDNLWLAVHIKVKEPVPTDTTINIGRRLFLGAGAGYYHGDYGTSITADLVNPHFTMFGQVDFLPGQTIGTVGVGMPIVAKPKLLISPFIGGRVTDQQDFYPAGGIRAHTKLCQILYATAMVGVELWNQDIPPSSDFSMNGSQNGIAWKNRFNSGGKEKEIRPFVVVELSYEFKLKGGAK